MSPLVRKSVAEVPVDSIRCRGMLFDLDGVLVDSTPAVARVWAWWAREHGFNADEVVEQAHGRPSIATIYEAENREVERQSLKQLKRTGQSNYAFDILDFPPLDMTV